MSVTEYTSKYEKLCRFSRICQGTPESYEGWKCIKYQGGLRENIMSVVAPLEIWRFSKLVNKARVIEDCAKKVALARDTRGGNNRGRGKYFQFRGQNFKRCGHAPQHRQGGYFTCGLLGHIAKDCPYGRNPNAHGNHQQDQVFTVNVNDAAKSDPLMRDKYFIGDKVLVTLYDTGASHPFIVFDKAAKLGLKISDLAFDLHVYTLSQTVVIRLGCRQISFKIEDRSFVHDLTCLPMVGLEMILGFDWLSKNRVLLDYFERSICFMSEGKGGVVVAKGYYLNSVMVNYSREECQGYILLSANASSDE
ncbi:uncharacterized protein LOC107647163 [Arachis ipaensis]|uniref:uncharacterized protein LOC107647163 n=1 Tax=Arachis ipaensis TaxID=130454 RepID=UPI0007AF7C1A|nr:uncharacterized protein LOC107647163 [Arachis ipaensis]